MLLRRKRHTLSHMSTRGLIAAKRLEDGYEISAQGGWFAAVDRRRSESQGFLLSKKARLAGVNAN